MKWQEQDLFRETLPHVQIKISSVFFEARGDINNCRQMGNAHRWCHTQVKVQPKAIVFPLSLLYSLHVILISTDSGVILNVLWMFLVHSTASGHQLSLIHIFHTSFYLNEIGLESWNKAPVHLSHSLIHYWTCLYILKDQAIVFEDRNAFEASLIVIITHSLHTFTSYMTCIDTFLMSRSILQSHFSDLLNSQKIICSAYLQALWHSAKLLYLQIFFQSL